MNITRVDVLTAYGFFKTYNAYNNAHFVELFGEQTEAEINAMDEAFCDIYGDLPLINKYRQMLITENDGEKVARRIVQNCDLRFFERWKTYKLAVMKAAELDYNAPYSETRTIAETTTGTANSTDTSEDTGRAFPYDEGAASDETQTSASAKSDSTDASERNYTETVARTGEKSAVQLATSQINFARSEAFLDLIFLDIAEAVCLPLYL